MSVVKSLVTEWSNWTHGDQVHCTVGGGNAPKQWAAIKQEEEHSALARDECITHWLTW